VLFIIINMIWKIFDIGLNMALIYKEIMLVDKASIEWMFTSQRLVISSCEHHSMRWIWCKMKIKDKTMPMWLTNAPSTFQRAMDYMLGKLKWQCCLNDIRLVFEKLIEGGYYLKLEKCLFCAKQLTYLGYSVSPKESKLILKRQSYNKLPNQWRLKK